jgi:putative PIG3 family NAD(P)H quinone oxidoreductase
MKAIIITQPGPPSVLKLQDRPVPPVGSGDVRIKIRAAGLNRPDVAQRKGNYPAPEGASPDIPGLEVSGIVEACGVDVERWKAGDRVCALLSGGGYAEYAVVPAGQCLPVPENLSFAEAAGLPETMFTVWHNVFQRGALKSGETLLVHGGSSGIGITAVQFASAMGARVLVTVGSSEKGAECLRLGASRWVNYKTSDFETEFAGEGVDVVLDMIGGDYFEKNINLLKPDGRLVYINAMNGNLVQLSIGKMMQKRISITGSTLRSRDTAFKSALAGEIERHVWPLIAMGRFKPVIFRTFPLEEAHLAHELMESSTHIGKIILLNG